MEWLKEVIIWLSTTGTDPTLSGIAKCNIIGLGFLAFAGTVAWKWFKKRAAVTKTKADDMLVEAVEETRESEPKE